MLGCTAGTVFRPGDVSATCVQVLTTSGMIPLNAYQKLRQRYLVNENNPVGWFWLCLCRGLSRLPRPGSGRRRQPGTCRWQRQPEPASMGHCPIHQLGSPSVPVVGAALIKKYSSYRTKQKKFHVFFPQNRSSGT